MRRVFYLILQVAKWLIFGIGLFAFCGYLYNVSRATLKGGFKGFLAIHHHNAYVNGRPSSFLDFIYYPLIIIIVFLFAYVFHFLTIKLKPKL